MAQLTESDKLLTKFEAENGSVEYYILMTSTGIPFKFSQSIVQDKGLDKEETVNPNYVEAVKICGLFMDLILYSKRTIEDLKKNSQGNVLLSLRLKDGKEFIVQQEQDFYLITKQVCKIQSDE